MDEILKNLLNNKVLNEETKDAIKDAFQKKLDEAKRELEKKIRADLAEQYKKDRLAIEEAFGKYVELELQSQVAELHEGLKQVDKLKVQYVEAQAKLKEQAKVYMKARLESFMEKVEGTLKAEIKELHESEKTNRRAYLKAIRDKSAQLESERVKFREKGAAVLENIINVKLTKALDELKGDIMEARKSDFGREIFEAYMTQFRRQFFNSRKEFQKLQESLKAKEAELSKTTKIAKKAVAEARDRAATAEAARAKLAERMERQQKMTKLLGTLNGESRRKMASLLEATKTADLEKAFRKFIPDILKEAKKPVTKPAKALTESKVDVRTGGQDAPEQDDDEIVRIQRRSGIR